MSSQTNRKLQDQPSVSCLLGPQDDDDDGDASRLGLKTYCIREEDVGWIVGKFELF